MINSCILCLMFGIVIGVIAAALNKSNNKTLPIKVQTNTGWNWLIWKTTIINGTLATLKKGNKNIMIIANNNIIIIKINGNSISINTKDL